ncbi:MAG TPA: prepilin-type N-terminal cleavage/methylation domain-containing protein [Burkholderiaceae bacterium]
MKTRGVTLVELLVAVGVLGTLAAVAVPYFGDLMSRRRVEMATAELATTIAYTRSEAGLRPTDVYVLFNPGKTCYTMAYWGFLGHCDCARGAGFACPPSGGWTEVRTVQIPASWNVKLEVFGPWAPTGYSNSLTYTRPLLRAKPDNFKAELTGPRGGRTRLVVSALGRLTVCTPDGSINGYKTCED